MGLSCSALRGISVYVGPAETSSFQAGDNSRNGGLRDPAIFALAVQAKPDMSILILDAFPDLEFLYSRSKL